MAWKGGTATKAPEKVRVDHEPQYIEGLPACIAMGMAMLEATGVRALIDRECRFDPEKRILSPGMVVKAIAGPMFDGSHKEPLYITDRVYASAPVDRLFGEDVERDNIYDVALARGLDALPHDKHELGELFCKCADLVAERYQDKAPKPEVLDFEDLKDDLLHMDATDFSTYCEEKEPEEGVAIPEHSGNPKDKRNDLLQYKMQFVSQGNLMIRQWMPYSGGTSDVVMNKDSLDFIESRVPVERRRQLTVVGDCKLVSKTVIDRIEECELGFVSRCPANFGKNAQENAINMAFEQGFVRKGERRYCDFDMDARFGQARKETVKGFRFVVTLDDTSVARSRATILKRASKEARKAAEKVLNSIYSSEDAARRAVEAVPESTGLVKLSFAISETEPPEGRRGAGRRWWRVDAMDMVDEDELTAAAERAAAFVHITNLPKRNDDAPLRSFRKGTTSEEIVRIYRDEIVVERAFRLTKTTLGIDEVYLQTPSRENAMMFVVAVVAMVKRAADAVFRRKKILLNGRQLTAYGLEVELQTVMVMYDRSQQRMYLQMGKGRNTYGVEPFRITDALGISPQLLVGYKSDRHRTPA